MANIQSVQSYIATVGAPSTLKELEGYALDALYLNIEEIVNGSMDNWTAPKWAVPGDILFFYHSKVSGSRINRLRRELEASIDDYGGDEYYTMSMYLSFLDEAFDKYGGKIFAVARVADRPYFIGRDEEDEYHWKSDVYADLKDIFTLNNPIDITNFNSFIKMSTQASIIPVEGKAFDKLVKVIAKENKRIKYLSRCKATPLPLRNINNSNWLKITREYRRRFHLESQFRAYYVDYLLRELGDKKKFFSECNCYKRGRLSGFADNAMLLKGKYIFVESKLNMESEPNLIKQLNKYIQVAKVELDKKTSVGKEDVYQNEVLVIDLDKICLYRKGKKKLEKIMSLDNLKSKEDIERLRKKILQCVDV